MGTKSKIMLLLTCMASLGCGTEFEELEPVKIGVLLPRTGNLNAFAESIQNGSRLAAHEINAAGGVLNGRPIELLEVDTATSPVTGAMEAQELIDQGVVALVGATGSAVSIAVAEVAGPNDIPQVSCCSSSPDLTELQGRGADRYFFRTLGSDLAQARAMAAAATQLMCERVAIAHEAGAYGEPFAAALKRALGRVAEEPLALPQSALDAEVRTTIATEPDCVVIIGSPPQAGAFIRSWNNLSGPPVLWIASDGVKDAQAITQEAGDPSFVNGLYVTSPETQGMTPSYNAFSAQYETFFEESTGVFSSTQYDALALLSLAIASAGTTDGPSVRDALKQVARRDTALDLEIRPAQLAQGLAQIATGGDTDYVGAAGNVDFDDSGDVVSAYTLSQLDSMTDPPVFTEVERYRPEDIE